MDTAAVLTLPSTPPLSVTAPISASLEQALAHVIATVPPDKRGSLTVSATLSGAQVEVAHRLSDNWTVAGYGAYWWATGATEVGGKLTGAWGTR